MGWENDGRDPVTARRGFQGRGFRCGHGFPRPRAALQSPGHHATGTNLPRIDGLLQLLDTRSFSSLWYWLLLAVAWSFSLRNVLGVPPEVVSRAARADDAGAGETGADAAGPDTLDALALLDWLSLTLPRWRLAPREAGVLTGLGAFGLSGLAGLGFGQDLELAQAAFLLLGPLALLLVLRLRLASRVAAELTAAQQGRMSANAAARSGARRLKRHRFAALGLAIAAVSAAAAWGTIWTLTHPWGPIS